MYGTQASVSQLFTDKHTGSKKKAQITYRASPNFGNCTLFLISTVKSLAALRRGTFFLQKKKKEN